MWSIRCSPKRASGCWVKKRRADDLGLGAPARRVPTLRWDRLGNRPREIVSVDASGSKAALWLPRRNCTTDQRFGLGATRSGVAA
jgi:hypothetical protein